jgi:DNA-binding NtrC family response regulator
MTPKSVLDIASNHPMFCLILIYQMMAFPEEQVVCFIPKPFSIDKVISTVARKMEERERIWKGRRT